MLSLILQNIQNNLDKTAYITKNESLSFKQLFESAYSLACTLNQEDSSCVLIYGHKQKEMLISILACILANRPYVPIDIFWPKQRIQEVIFQTQATTLIEVSSYPYDNISTISCNSSYSNKPLHSFDNEIAYILFTSGSMGKPKGVKITYDNLLNFAYWLPSVFQEIPASLFNQASFCFDLSVVELICCLCYGTTFIACDQDTLQDLNQLFEFIKQYQPHGMVVTPTFLQMLFLHPFFDEKHFPFIQSIYSCGETLFSHHALKLLNRFPHLKLINAYGPTEATSAISAIQITKEMCHSILPVGRMDQLACHVKIVNDEIVLSGKSLFAGYLNSDEIYSEYPTKDRGYILDNLLYCVGRMDSQIKYRGYRIELLEIEETLISMKEIMSCMVIPIYDSFQKVKLIHAYVVGDITKQAIIQYLEERLPFYMIPKKIFLVDQLPKNDHFKLDRRNYHDRD